MDTINTFLNSILDKIVYLEYSSGFKIQEKVWFLIRALYRLRRSPRLWQKKLTKILEEFNLIAVAEDLYLFASKNLLIIFFIDDIIILYSKNNKSEALAFRQALETRYKLRNIEKTK